MFDFFQRRFLYMIKSNNVSIISILHEVLVELGLK